MAPTCAALPEDRSCRGGAFLIVIALSQAFLPFLI